MRILLIIIALLAAGCAFLKGDKEDEAKNWTVERLYSEAKGALESSNYAKAVQYYEFLETRFPFGVYGQQSLLDLAYVYYKTEDFDSSISACDRFIRLYPQNPHVDYAYYLKGLGNFNRGRGFTERYLPIDLSQRDTGASMQSFQDFSELLAKFPDSPYREDTGKRMVYLRNILAQNEVNVANYYMRRGAYVAAANRARYVVENYPRTPAMPDALVLMVKAYKVMEMDDLANDALRVLELNYPNHPGIAEIQRIEVN
ncbi:MAG: outer membrane protein assembly factor BamD [Gammaproteobacteria bacterium]|nr:outer membrane protein assembly factor BamD [Gammaproteobacteria bacterium]